MKNLQHRKKQTGKTIPENIVEQQITSFEQPTMDEGFDEIIGVPYEFITPLFEYKTTILLLHGFNSGPGNKERVIKEIKF